MLVKLEWLGYCMVKKLWRYIKPFSSDTETLRTDGQTDRRTDRQTDRQTDLLYQYRASVCWRAIKIVLSSFSHGGLLLQLSILIFDVLSQFIRVLLYTELINCRCTSNSHPTCTCTMDLHLRAAAVVSFSRHFIIPSNSSCPYLAVMQADPANVLNAF